MKQLINLKTSLNTSYLTDSYIVFTLKMESVSKITIFDLKNFAEKCTKAEFAQVGIFFTKNHIRP